MPLFKKQQQWNVAPQGETSFIPTGSTFHGFGEVFPFDSSTQYVRTGWHHDHCPPIGKGQGKNNGIFMKTTTQINN